MPQFAVLPMGWSHALWWCQLLHCRIMSNVGGLPASQFLKDKVAPPSLSELVYTIYVDNFLVFGTSPEFVKKTMDDANQRLQLSGLPTHEVCLASKNAEVLGWEFEGGLGVVRPSRRRAWRTRLAIDFLLSRRQVSASDLEKVLGHMTFLALLRRETLVVLRACYTFIARHRYHGAVPLWPSVRRELHHFRCLIPPISRQLRTSWYGEVCCTDTPYWGYGCVESSCDEHLVARAGRVSEHWLYSHPSASNRRRDILDCRPPEPGLDEADTPATRAAAASALPHELLHGPWRVNASFPWADAPHVVEGEGRAIFWAVKHRLRTGGFRETLSDPFRLAVLRAGILQGPLFCSRTGSVGPGALCPCNGVRHDAAPALAAVEVEPRRCSLARDPAGRLFRERQAHPCSDDEA